MSAGAGRRTLPGGIENAAAFTVATSAAAAAGTAVAVAAGTAGIIEQAVPAFTAEIARCHPCRRAPPMPPTA